MVRPLMLLCVAALGCGTLRAGKLLRDAVRPAEELAPRVVEDRARMEGLDVYLYRPLDRDGPLPQIVLCHGGDERGATDPRLVALARAFAIRGAEVLTPDLASLREQRIDASAPSRIARIARSRNGDVALVGISIGGSYALVAATRPELRGRVAAVLTFGCYDDLEVLLTHFLAGSFAEGRGFVLLGNVARLVPPAERTRVEGILRGAPQRGGLSAASRRVVRAARAPVDRDDARRILAPLRGDLAALSPRTPPDAPVFLLHGTGDPIVPPEHSRRLYASYRSQGAQVELLITDVFAHAGSEGGRAPSLFEAWPLLRFLARFLSLSGL